MGGATAIPGRPSDFTRYFDHQQTLSQGAWQSATPHRCLLSLLRSEVGGMHRSPTTRSHAASRSTTDASTPGPTATPARLAPALGGSSSGTGRALLARDAGSRGFSINDRCDHPGPSARPLARLAMFHRPVPGMPCSPATRAHAASRSTTDATTPGLARAPSPAWRRSIDRSRACLARPRCGLTRLLV
jgi:hypothetical protein